VRLVPEPKVLLDCLVHARANDLPRLAVRCLAHLGSLLERVREQEGRERRRKQKGGRRKAGR
jgi:hypothetical protein